MSQTTSKMPKAREAEGKSKVETELQELRLQHQQVLDRLESVQATLLAVQNERRALLYVVEALAKLRKDVGPLIEELKVQYSYKPANDWVSIEEYEDVLAENELLQRELQAQSVLSPAQQVDTNLQMEVMRLTAENIALKAGAEKKEAERMGQEAVDGQLHRQVSMRPRPRSMMVHQYSLPQETDVVNGNGRHKEPSTRRASNLSGVSEEVITLRRSDSDQSLNSVTSSKSARERRLEMLGAFAYDASDEDHLVERLVYDVNPRMLCAYTPGLVAHTLFMCIRYLDYANDAAGLQSLLKKVIAGIQEVIKAQAGGDDSYPNLDVLVFWLANCCRLLSDMKQYSGDTKYATNPRPGQSPLQNFDLTEYRRVLAELSIMIHKLLLKLLQEEIGPIAVTALLYHEALTGQPTARPTPTPSPDDDFDDTVESLIQWFEDVKVIFERHYVDPEVTYQTISGLVTYALGVCFNHLVTTPDLCTDMKALQITFNVQQFHNWLRNDRRLASKGRMLCLLMEAINVLQLPKGTAENIESICMTCKELHVSQIQQLLMLYTGEDGHKIPAAVMEEGLRKKWEEAHARVELPPPLLVDVTRYPPITIPYTPKDILLVDISPPEFMGLTMLKKI